MLGACSWRKPPKCAMPVAASYLHAGNPFRKPGSIVRIDAAQGVWDGIRDHHRHRPGYDQLRGVDHLRREAGGGSRGRRRHRALVRRAGRDRQHRRRAPGPQPVRRRSRAHGALHQAPHGLRRAGADGVRGVFPAGDLGLHPQGAPGAGGPRAGSRRAQGGHHRPGLLHRRPAPGDPGGGGDRGAGGRADRQRADGRTPLRPRIGRSWSI